MKRYFVAGIGTNVGKTVVSAILTEALKADYWKPIQAGDLDYSDSDRVRDLVSNPDSIIHPEAYRLRTAASPHLAAKLDGIEMDHYSIIPPSSARTMVIEGAGGLLAPINKKYLYADLIKHLGAEVILVSRNYLGSINHTLLTMEALKARKIFIRGLIFNCDGYLENEEYIQNYTGMECLAKIPTTENLTKEKIREFAKLIRL